MNNAETEWVKANLRIKSIDEISSVLNFSICWNLFEHIIFDDDYRPSQIAHVFNDYTNKFEPIQNSTQEILEIFTKRYFCDGEFTAKFHTLYLRRSDNKSIVQEYLSGAPATSCEKFVVAITIIGRFRNNLFHGLKDPSEIRDQNRVFEQINKYLMEIVEAMRNPAY